MPLRFEDKKALVTEVNEVAKNSLSALAAEYRGLTVAQMTNFRAAARKQGVWVRVVKNTLARRALEGTEFECMNDSLKGPLVLAFSQEDPGAAARVARDFIKDNDKMNVTALALGGEALPGDQLARIASLPTRDQALSMLLATMKAPTEKFVRTLAAPTLKMVRTIVAVKDQKAAS